MLISRKFKYLEGFSNINFKSESRLLIMLEKGSMSKLSNIYEKRRLKPKVVTRKKVDEILWI